jgi:hypothetical protein
MHYNIRNLGTGIRGRDFSWPDLAPALVGQFLPQSSEHRPRTVVRLYHDPQGIQGRFEVADRFVRCVRTDYAEENSHPHWAAWAPVDEFNFHLPRCFGELRFA